MDLTNSQKYLVIAVVIVLVAAVAGGAWYLTKDSENGTNVKDVAKDMADSYSGAFGPFELDSSSTSGSSTLVKENDSDRQKYSKINFKEIKDPKGEFNEIKKKIASTEGFMGGTITEVSGITGFDDVAVYKMDIRMGTMTAFTMLYFVGYVGDVLVESSEMPLYHAGSLATSAEITEVMKALSDSMKA